MKTQPFKLVLIIATLMALAGITHAGDEKDPFKKSNAPPKTAAVPPKSAADAAEAAAEKAAIEEAASRLVSVHEEAFSLPIADAFALLRKFRSDADRYKEIVRRVEAGQARVERRVVLRATSGQQAKTESVYEFPNPTPHENSKSARAPQRNRPGERPSAAAQRSPGAGVPGGSQTRHVGDTLEFTAIPGEIGIINLTLIPEVSRFAGYTGPGDGKGPQQLLLERQRILTSAVVVDGEPFLLGTLNPPFNNGVATEPKEQRVWLDFLTAHILPEQKKVLDASALGAIGVGVFTSVHEETFSLPSADADALLRKCRSDADRYNEIVRRAEAGQARIERLLVLRTVSGQSAKTESVEPPAPAQRRPGVAVPGDFRTRNVGDTLLITPMIGSNELITVSLVLDATHFTGCKDSGDGKGSQQLSFEGQTIVTSFSVKGGEPCLLGTLNPSFNNGVATDQKEKRVWLAFLTVHSQPEGKEVSADTQRVLLLAPPDIRFTNAKIADVLASLTTKSRELDPNKRGVNFVLRAPPGKVQEKITLGPYLGQNLFIAACSVAKEAGLQLSVQDNTVILHPEGEKP
ncbi:MAG: hypothetical protein WA117_03215 [Verrucomicrobiia bacterium]